MTTHGRYVGSGVQPLVDAVKAAGGDPGDLRAAVWQATWARGYEEVVAPPNAVRLKEEGFVVFSRAISENSYATVVDMTHALWALIARGVVPPAGSRVRIVPAIADGELSWDVTILEMLGLGLSIRFGPKVDETPAWIEAMRGALDRIRYFEIERRKAIVVERRALVAIEPVKPLRAVLDALQEDIRQRVEAETGGTVAQRLAFEKGNDKQRKAVLEEIKAHRLTRFNEEIARLREQIPEMTAAHERQLAAHNAGRALVAELEDAASRSRSVSEEVTIVEHRLATVVTAGMLVSADLDVLNALGAGDFVELARTIELLHDLIPRRASKRPTSG